MIKNSIPDNYINKVNNDYQRISVRYFLNKSIHKNPCLQTDDNIKDRHTDTYCDPNRSLLYARYIMV